MPDRSSKRSKGTAQLAKPVVDIAAGGRDDRLRSQEMHSAASLLGRLGGLKGGRARAEKLSPKRRSQIARIAAVTRWRKHDD
jgi:hypothetical protein